MTTDQLLQLDCRVDENRHTIQKALRKIKPFSNVPETQDVPLPKVEKMLKLLMERYEVDVTWILVSHDDENMLYTISLRNGKASELYQAVYGITLYEVMCKCVICAWSMVKNGVLKKRR